MHRLLSGSLPVPGSHGFRGGWPSSS